MAFSPINTLPVAVPRRLRREHWRGKTSMRAGVLTPVAYFALAREEAIRGEIAVQCVTMETVRPVANPVNVRFQAWLVPHVALERFQGSMEVFNRSYTGEKMFDGSAAPVLFSQRVASAAVPDAVLQKLGLHVKDGKSYNFDLTRSYNVLANWIRASISDALPLASEDVLGLRRGQWMSQSLDYIKPSFDAAQMEGEVALTISGSAPVSGFGVRTAGLTDTAAVGYRSTIGDEIAKSWLDAVSVSAISPNAHFAIKEDPARPGYPSIHAELAATSASLSLANMKMAQQLQSFAMLRDKYAGIQDEYLIDLLMMGVRIPEEDLRKPILLGEVSTVFGMNERWATDGQNLDMSRSNGYAAAKLRISSPPVNTGGVVIVVAEIAPEPLWERVEDVYLSQPSAGDLPEYVRDATDPQKVEIVKKGFVDVLHSDASGIFGYAPLNHRWDRTNVRVGGKFIRRADDRWSEDRQGLWSANVKDPVLGSDFYLVPANFPHSVFADQTVDPFEVTVLAPMQVSTLTVFGGVFEEDHASYEKLLAQADSGRVQPPAALTGPTLGAAVDGSATPPKGDGGKPASGAAGEAGVEAA